MTDFKATHKEALVTAFLRGESVTDLSAFFAVVRGTVEDVIREAIIGLSKLKAPNQDVRDAKNEVLLGVNEVLEAETDLSIAHGMIEGQDVYSLVRTPKVISPVDGKVESLTV